MGGMRSAEEIKRKSKGRERKRAEGKKVKVGYRKIEIQGKTYVWNEERNEII